MNRTLVRKGFRAAPLVAGLLLACTAGPASAAEFWLRAGSFVKTMPDGAAVTMWGYASCTGVNSGCGPTTVPGPALAVPAGEALTIHLYNNGLPEAVSITIPGQPVPTGNAVVRNLDGRIRAFTQEAAPNASADYLWPASQIKAGTYLYQSGSHPAVQVQMGLYGALKSDASALNAYGAPDPAYDADQTLLYSEIDPALHAAVAAGHFGPLPATPPPVPAGWMTSTVNYNPRYFLLNGNSFQPGMSPVTLGTPGQRVLLRLLNAGLKTRLPSFSGLTLEMIAEDGNRVAAGREVDGVQAELYAGKTLDAFTIVPAAGYYPVYDRAMGLTTALAPGGGMLTAFQVADATQYALTVSRIGTGGGTVRSASQPGGIACGADCTESYNAGTGVTLVATPNVGSFFQGWSGDCGGRGDCVATMSAARSAIAEFRLATLFRVIVPNGGGIPEGSFYTIRWEMPSSVRHVTIHYSTNAGASWKLIERGVSGNSLVWRVPLVPSDRPQSRVRIRFYNASNVRIGTDTSADFTIQNVIAASR